MKSLPRYSIMVCGLLFQTSLGAVKQVPADYPTLQSAIDASAQGDTVLVSDGRYAGAGNFDITWNATVKHLVIRSRNGATRCTLDIQQSGRGFVLDSGQDKRDVIDGFTIINGWVKTVQSDDQPGGGAIFCNATSPQILNSVFLNNVAGDTFFSISKSWYADGGAIDCKNGSAATIVNNVFENNYANHTGGALHFSGSTGLVANNIIRKNKNIGCYGGGGIALTAASPTIVGNLICENISYYYDKGGYGGGIICLNANPYIINNTIVNNTTVHGDSIGEGGGIRVRGLPSPIIRNCILWNNVAKPGLENLDFQYNQWVLDIANCDIQNGLGTINSPYKTTIMNAPPGFVDEANGMYELTPNSPGVNTGTTSGFDMPLPLTDLSGHPRICGTAIDMGAYEYQEVSATRAPLTYKNDRSIKVQTNPGSNRVVLEFSATSLPVNLWVYDCAGRIVEREINLTQHRYVLNCTGFARGVYVVKIQNDNHKGIPRLLRFAY